MTNLITTIILTNLLVSSGGKLYERNWQVAANEQYFKGRLEVVNSGGRCDIVTDEYAIEVDPIERADKAIEQANRYASALSLKPAIAVYVPNGSILTVTNAPCHVFVLRNNP